MRTRAPMPVAAPMAASVLLSVLGMAYHTVHEFGVRALGDPASGMLPVALVQLALLAAWWRYPHRSRGLGVALAAIGILQLVGGAILSVLPLPFLPFAPEQTAGHYLSHLVLGLSQIPLIVLPLRRPRD